MRVTIVNPLDAVECDFCGEVSTIPTGRLGKYDNWTGRRGAGWAWKTPDSLGETVHICPNCQSDPDASEHYEDLE